MRGAAVGAWGRVAAARRASAPGAEPVGYSRIAFGMTTGLWGPTFTDVSVIPVVVSAMLASSCRSETLGTYPVRFESRLERQLRGCLHEAVRAADEGDPRLDPGLGDQGGIQAARVPDQPSGGSRVKVSKASSPSSSA